MFHALLLLTLWIPHAGGAPSSPPPQGDVATDAVRLNDDGGWCWFEDERAVLANGRVWVGSIATGRHDPARKGDVDVAVWDLATKSVVRVTLHEDFQRDDHNSPALWERPDGRIVAVYAKHGPESCFYTRITEQPGDPSAWTPARKYSPSESSRITYSNPHFLADEGLLYNFFRGLDGEWKPSFVTSADGGETWQRGGILIRVPATQKHRPYAKYASNGTDTVHLAYTEGHPRNYDNSIYHLMLRKGALLQSDGTRVRSMAEGLERPEEGTKVFQGSADQVAWIQDLHLDADGHPVLVYSVQVGSAGLSVGQGGDDHRMHLARFDGKDWAEQEIAYTGSRLYAREDDYVGGVALLPGRHDTVVLSSDVDPLTGERLPSGHYELFLGRAAADDAAWTWTALTQDSSEDQLRPIVPITGSHPPVLLWLRGTYRTYTDYDLDVMAWQAPAGWPTGTHQGH